MTDDNFVLSSKIYSKFDKRRTEWGFNESDVKEFIRRLKNKQYVWVTDDAKTGKGHYQISPVGIFIKVEDLDKLAGLDLK